MALNVTLYQPFVSIIETQSPNGYTKVIDGTLFGTVSGVYPMNLVVDVGDSVMFNLSDCSQVSDGTNIYYIIDEKLISFKELPLT